MLKFKWVLFITLFQVIGSGNFFGIELEWKKLTPAIFEQAKKENKIVLLNLGANWCHWCHVMHDSTYHNEVVINYINKFFIPVLADQDANPELSIRYKDYGWPATIFLNAKGEDVVKRRGYIEPESFLKLLKAIVVDPTPEMEPQNFSKIKVNEDVNQKLIQELIANFSEAIDYKVGGFNQSQKFIEYVSYEYALFYSKIKKEKIWTQTSTQGAKKMSDPVWGGIYQYSTHGDWNHLHFEKLLSIQARYLKIFLYQYSYMKDRESLVYANAILQYTKRFLKSSNGLYYNAQDADVIKGQHAEEYFKLNDTQRLAQGIPAIDSNCYTQNNADFANALLLMYATTGDEKYLQQSKIILNVLTKRKSNLGLYFSSDNDESGIFSLKDQIAIAELLIEFLKCEPNNREYHQSLVQIIESINKNFIPNNGNGSAISFVGNNGLSPEPTIIENVKLGRVFNWYGQYAKSNYYKEAAIKIYKFVVHPEVAKEYYSRPEILLLYNEINAEPNQYVYVEPVHGKSNNFYNSVLSKAPFYSIFNYYNNSNLPPDKAQSFSGFNEDVLFVCTSKYCSAPIFNEVEVLNLFNINE